MSSYMPISPQTQLKCGPPTPWHELNTDSLLKYVDQCHTLQILHVHPLTRHNRTRIQCREVRHRHQAESYQNWLLLTERSTIAATLNIPQTPEQISDCFWSDLYGCEVYDPQNQILGTVCEIVNYGASDIAIITSIQPPHHKWMLPLHDQFFELISSSSSSLHLRVLMTAHQLEEYRS